MKYYFYFYFSNLLHGAGYPLVWLGVTITAAIVSIALLAAGRLSVSLSVKLGAWVVFSLYAITVAWLTRLVIPAGVSVEQLNWDYGNAVILFNSDAILTHASCLLLAEFLWVLTWMTKKKVQPMFRWKLAACLLLILMLVAVEYWRFNMRNGTMTAPSVTGGVDMSSSVWW